MKLFLCFLLFAPNLSIALPKKMPNIRNNFESFKGCFLIKELGAKQILSYNESHCKKRWRPCSTYKILNSLIALESKALKERGEVIAWDGTKQPYKSWEKNHTLRSAIKYSVVPFYQELARRIGRDQTENFLKLTNYGNARVGKHIDRFWLDGPLKVSGTEQLRFMEQLYLDKLPFKKIHQKFVKEILVQKKSLNGTYSGKTGSAFDHGKFTLGWFVGHLIHKTKSYVFVINIEGNGANGQKARKIANKVLTELGISLN